MFLPPGGAVAVEFQAQAGAEAIALTDTTAVVVRDGIDTAVVTAIASPGVGRYVVSFTVPSGWAFPQRVAVRLRGEFNGMAAELTKAVGQVGDPLSRILDLSKGLGREPGISATVLDAAPGRPGYLITSDGAIAQTLTLNEDGSVTIANTPD